MARGKKIDNEKIAEVVASYALTNNYSETAREVGICANSVKNIVDKQKQTNPEEYERVCEEKKELFQNKANRIIDKALLLLERRYDTAIDKQNELDMLMDAVYDAKDNDGKELSGKEKLDIAKKISKLEINSLSEITTSLGTLYDKMRLASGESTNNETIKVEMSQEIKDLSK